MLIKQLKHMKFNYNFDKTNATKMKKNIISITNLKQCNLIIILIKQVETNEI